VSEEIRVGVAGGCVLEEVVDVGSGGGVLAGEITRFFPDCRRPKGDVATVSGTFAST
jgi:hypothetical protein